MEYPYLFYISFPLITYLIFVIWYELKTGLILDKVVIPASVFFISAPFLLKNSHWLSHVAGLVASLLFFLLAASIYAKVTGKEGIGGGAIKLMASVGAAVGFEYSIQLALIFTLLIVGGIIFAKIFGKETMPSSPFAMMALLIIITFHKSISWSFG